MKIRAARVADFDDLAQLFTDAVHSLADGLYSAEQCAAWAPQPPELAVWRERLMPVETLVAEEGGQLLGFVSYKPDGYVAFMFTAPQAARRGIASRLFGLAEEAMRALGAERLYTEASLASAPLFAARGFVIDEEQDVERRGVMLRRYAMSKALT
jgi:putative acetyltransferase